MKTPGLRSIASILLLLILSLTALSGQDPCSADKAEYLFSDSSSVTIVPGLKSSETLFSIKDKNLLKRITNKKYLILKCEQEDYVSGVLHISFFKGDTLNDNTSNTPALYAEVGILPQLESFVIFPLDYLDGQKIFIPRFPRQLKGVVFGNRIDPEELSGIIITRKNSNNGSLRIKNIFICDTLPNFDLLSGGEVVDKYGQWKLKNWKKKINSEKDWLNHSRKLEEIAEEENHFPEEFSDYGGWREIRFDSTGFFHTHHDGERWWFVDPHGFAFLSFGMDVVYPAVQGILSGNENLYSYLPEKDELFGMAYGTARDLQMADFFRINMMQIFGENWYEKWMQITKNKLISANFNTLGNWSDKFFIEKSRIPYVLTMDNFPETGVYLYRDFPDVFSPEYRANAEKFASQLKKYKEDPFMIGYFLRNEPQWAFGNKNLAFEMMANDQFSYTKTVLALWLKKKYGTSDSLSNQWKMDFKSFTDILTLTLDKYPSSASRDDLWEFSKIMVKKYVETVVAETRKADPNHLNLGMRYSYISSDLLYIAGHSFDVFSINGYHAPGPPDTREILEQTGKPVIIGEFHFGATDRGLPSTGLKAVKNQRQRGIAYRYYLEQGFSRPEVIGIHYFQWMDQPVLGRFDGENYNIGFNDILYQSYESMFDQAKRAHKNAYPVAAGIKNPFSRKPHTVPPVAF